MVKIRYFLNMITSLFFATAIFVPSIAMLTTSDQEISESEQRTLAQLPENTNPFNQQFAKFVDDIEVYINDQFGCRDQLIYWHNYFKVVYMQKSPTDQVVIGTDNWLFFTQPNQIEDHQGLSILTEEDLAAWASLFNYRYEWLAERGIEYVLVIAPDKKSIYPEYFPEQYPIINENNTQLDQLLPYLAEHSPMQIIDLREPLLAYKNDNPDGELLYYTADTHWTPTGAWVGYQALMTELANLLPSLQPVNEDMLFFEPLENPLQGSLNMMDMPDLAEFLTEDYQQVCYVDAEQCSKLSELSACQEIDYQYSYQSASATQYECSQHSVNTIIFHDSFGWTLKPHLVRTFANGVSIARQERFWLISPDFEILLDDVKPDIVIEEMVERIFTDKPHPSRLPPVE